MAAPRDRREWTRAWRAANPEQNAATKKRAYANKQNFVAKFKDKPCKDCGIQYPPYVMDFDHVTGVKELDLAHASGASYDRIVAEIGKCELVCANCHRMRSYKRLRGWE